MRNSLLFLSETVFFAARLLAGLSSRDLYACRNTEAVAGDFVGGREPSARAGGAEVGREGAMDIFFAARLDKCGAK